VPQTEYEERGQVMENIYRHLVERRCMKNLFFIVLLVAVLMTAGCSGGNQNTVVTPARATTVTTVTTTIPATVKTQVPLYYLKGNIGDCFSDPEKKFYEICLADDANVSLRNNTVSASGTIFFRSTSLDTHGEEKSYYDQLKGVNGSVALIIFYNKTIQVAEVTRMFSVAKNGKIPVYFDTEISENPAGLTYTLAIEKINPEILPTTAVPVLTPYQECTIDSHQRYRTSMSEWLVFGSVSNTGTLSGNCRVNVQLIAYDGSYLDNRDQIVFVSGGGTAPFSITVNEPADKPGAYYKIFVYNQDIE